MTKILIIEDEWAIAELERDYLEVNGFHCEIVTTGNEGLQRAVDEEFDLILLDLMLPGMDGFQICEEIRKAKDIPILMVTARKEDIDLIRGFNRGADDYIEKPFNPNELVARVKAHLARYHRLVNRDEPRQEILVRGLLIDQGSHRAFINGAEKVFTAKEFDLLTFLATHPNQVFSKEDLFERIWGMDSAADTSTVTVHIRKIREKIEENPAKPEFIETIRGVGYRFK